MIKFIAAAVWICAVTLGAVFYSFQNAGAKPEAAAPPPAFGGLDYIKTEVISVPVFHDSRIDGYFLTRLVYTVEPEKMAKLTIPAEALIVDEVYGFLFSNPTIDFTRAKTMDVTAFKEGIRDSVNRRIGDELIHEVLVEQIDFLSKNEIRDNAIRRRAVEMKAPIFGVSTPEQAAKPAH